MKRLDNGELQVSRDDLLPVIQSLNDYTFGSELSEDRVKFDDANPNVSWIQMFPVGRYNHPAYGEIDINAERVERFAQNINDGVRGTKLDIDYAHKKDPAKGEKAAGWITTAQAREDGLWAQVEWTPTAAQEIRDGEWKYFSPEFQDEWEHPKTKTVHNDVVFGGALTNRPFLKDILPVGLSEFFLRDIPKGTRDKADAADFAGKNRSFPILKAEDVVAAFHSLGRAGADNYSVDKIRANIIRIAKRKGFPLPKSATKVAHDTTPDDPDGDGDDDTMPSTDTDNSHWDKDGKKKPLMWNGYTPLAAPRSVTKKASEDREVEVELTELVKALGLSENATEEDVLAAITALKANQAKPEDTEARKFAEMYPEQAKQLADQAKQLKEAQVASKLSELSHNRETNTGLPPVLHDKYRTVRLSLDDDEAAKFDELMAEVVKVGPAAFNEIGSTRPKTGSESGEAETFDEAVEAWLTDEKNAGKSERDAVKAVAKTHPQLYSEWRNAPRARAAQGGGR